MSNTEHLTQSGEPDMRFKENKEAYGDDNNTSNQGSNNNNNNYDNNNNNNNNNRSGNQSTGQNYSGTEKRDGGPDMRFKENQEGEPYQMDNLRGQGRGANDDSGSGNNQDRGNYQDRGNSNQGRGESNQNDGPSEHLTQTGEPDMRFKENKEAYGQT